MQAAGITTTALPLLNGHPQLLGPDLSRGERQWGSDDQPCPDLVSKRLSFSARKLRERAPFPTCMHPRRAHAVTIACGKIQRVLRV